MEDFQVHEKVKRMGLAGELRMKRGKAVIPIPAYFLDTDITAKLYVLHNLRKKAITPEQSNGYKASITDRNAYTIWQKLPLTTDGYCDLEHVDKFMEAKAKKEGGFMGSISLGNAFRVFVGNDRNDYDYYSFNAKLKAFFKYMPQLSYIYKRYVDNKSYFESTGFGYCCEDCDGPADYYYKQNFRNCIETIRMQLDKIQHV